MGRIKEKLSLFVIKSGEVSEKLLVEKGEEDVFRRVVWFFYIKNILREDCELILAKECKKVGGELLVEELAYLSGMKFWTILSMSGEFVEPWRGKLWLKYGKYYLNDVPVQLKDIFLTLADARGQYKDCCLARAAALRAQAQIYEDKVK